MPAEVVSLSGQKLDSGIAAVTPLSVLETVVADIRAGKINPYQVVVLMSEDSGRGDCTYSCETNDLKVHEVYTRLGIETVLVMARVLPSTNR